MKLHIVPARAGLDWVRLGIRVFWRQPMALAALFFMTMAAMSLATLLPLIGPAVALALLPSATLAMMVAAGEATQGRFPTPALLLVAFRTGRQRLRDMLILGALYAVGFLAVMAISALVDDGQFARVYLGGEQLTREVAEAGDFQAAMWLALALYVPLSLLFWHAPGLVHWHGVPPVKALFFSMVACLRNFSAFTVYGLVWTGVFLGAGIVVSIGVTLLALLGLGSGVAGGIMVATALMLAAMFFTSVVFSFRDCFEPPERRLVPPPSEAAAEPPGPL
ncbi:membrane protein [Acidovorax sp. SUPP950]|uniref:BPSS1780 family membrane protein n=1 Tax=unclassified Acidovorax TaxID=2684926 RepID=UPI0023D7A4D0|nr:MULTISPECIES: BPSS1780 family membrane protein [Comamonadaceae]WOI43575.1 BPSS1780 family membrane protein [Paracidovorax avenae]GKS74311.1 membrane protein [Acidovorax sp. SUPP950]